MLRIYQKFLFVLCVAATIFVLLGLYPDTLTVPKTPDGQLRDILSIGYTGRGQFINRYGDKNLWESLFDDDANDNTEHVSKEINNGGFQENPFGNSSTESNNNTCKSLDYRQPMKSDNQSINQSAITPKPRPDTCSSCFPQSSYIYKNDKLCSTTNITQVKLLVIILTIHKDMRTRNTLRKTWLSISNQNTGELRYVFLLGKHTRDPKWNIRILDEARKYGDILIKDFMDEYKNLTFKTMSGLQWAAEFCSNAKYVMKTDADMWVNTPRLLKLIDSFEIKNEMIGACYSNKSHPIRNKKSKWYASYLQYPQKFYPGFCSGTGYITTMQVVKDIVKVSSNIPLFFLEDIYVALCIEALGYTVRPVKGFHAYGVKYNPCRYKEIIITSHHIPRRVIEKVWNTKCSNQTGKGDDESIDQSDITSKARPDTCNSCFPQSSYIYKNDKLCSTTNSTQVKLLVIIFTVHIEVKTRNTLRKTWLSISNQNTGELRYVFLLGKHTRVPKWNIRILEEAKKYGDILIKDFMDEYKNLTLKTMSGLQWAAEFCSNAKYVMKTDADMWVNTPRLLKLIDSFEIKNEIIGACYSNKSHPIRNKKSKYYASYLQYPEKLYPGFCSGTGYVTTMRVVKDIVKVSSNIPLFFLEDIYIALCIQALGYKVRPVEGFHAFRVKFNPCGYKKIITSHHVPRKAIEIVWNSKCSNRPMTSNDKPINQLGNTSKPRPDTCSSCFPQSSYIYKNDKLCSTTNSTQVKLLMIILSIHNDMRTRNTLRKTWLSISKQNTGELRYVFLLGHSTMDQRWNLRALAEAKKYGDILIKNFIDEYKNLTLKTMSGLQWAAEFCPNTKYVMKTHADMWVNTPRLLQFIDSYKINNEIIGACYSNKSHPIRDEGSIYYVSHQHYPHKLYPGFCSGTGYVTTIQVVKAIVKVSPNIPFFVLEDIYVALCIQALGYTVRSVEGFHAFRVKFNPCGYKKIITSHRLPRGAIAKVWNAKCLNQTKVQP